uniref:DUF4220 domain-containing protein n=1 Tax=Leersia perrieri TaxID=77586 RepID=A0A0D9XU89_9ORYZ
MPFFVVSAARAILAAMRRLLTRDEATQMASVQVWVLLTTLLLLVRFLVDFSGIWYAALLSAGAVHILELLNYSMVVYTLGLMQLSAARVNDFFQVWAVLMVTLEYSVKVGLPYYRSQRLPILDLMASFWTANLLRVQTVLLLKIPLWLIWSVNAGRIITYFLHSDRSSSCNEENVRLVTDFMRYEHTLSATTSTDTMTGYKYLVLGEDLKKMRDREPGSFRLVLDVEHKSIVTVEKIWEHRNDSRSILGTGADPDDRSKDVCLSFALYKLLRRQFYHLPLHEAGLEKTRKLVFDVLLQEKNDFERAFRITGMELSFLRDFFHNKHAQMFTSGFPIQSLVLSLLLIAATGYIAYPVGQIPARMDPKDHNRITHGVLITRIIVALIICKELSEITMYVFSEWTKVQMICMHVKHPRFGRCWLVDKVTRCMFRLINKGRWKHKIRQYNILISSLDVKMTMNRLFPPSIKLETEARKAILVCFKALEHKPELLGAYCSNAFGSKPGNLQWAINLEADTHRILVWHIATCLCEINLTDGEAWAMKTIWLRPRPFVNRSRTLEEDGVWDHYQTATSLSNYCAYLLTRSLVPDTGLVADKVFNEVRRETKVASFTRHRCKSLQDVYDKIMQRIEEPRKTSVAFGKKEHEKEDKLILMGARLGKQLMTAYAADRVGLWEDLAKFWSGFLLHLAANTRASRYRLHFAGNGELITHLWALMSHAGFLTSTNHGHMMLDPKDLADLANVGRPMAEQYGSIITDTD